MDDSFECITPDGLVYSNPSSSEIDSSSTPSGPTLNEAKLAILQSCKLAKLTKDHPVMWKDIQKAYKVENNADLDDKFINQRLQTIEAMEADDDAFFAEQLHHFSRN
uniref:Uncharacterized protein n=1 Tax=Panagrellus redivivus TaxID=6233 RepID=A0A7E4VK76_PANRE